MDRVDPRSTTWALILAAGEGRRLRRLTTAPSGVTVPKQFCSLRGGPSLLQQALHRARQIAKPARVCTIVAAQHRRWWEHTLALERAATVIVQPANRGTAHGILLPLLHILERDPRATLVVLPSDHHVRDEATLAASMREAVRQLADHPSEVLLLGMVPDEPDPELGYILPGRSATGRSMRRVERFVEKPAASLASELIAQGALWNALILAARAEALLDLYRPKYAELIGEMRTAVRRELERDSSAAPALTSLYERLPLLDFSRHILEGQESRLRAWPVALCGWSDLGTPQRVARALRQLPRDSRCPPSAPVPSCGRGAQLDLATQCERLQADVAVASSQSRESPSPS